MIKTFESFSSPSLDYEGITNLANKIFANKPLYNAITKILSKSNPQIRKYFTNDTLDLDKVERYVMKYKILDKVKMYFRKGIKNPNEIVKIESEKSNEELVVGLIFGLFILFISGLVVFVFLNFGNDLILFKNELLNDFIKIFSVVYLIASIFFLVTYSVHYDDKYGRSTIEYKKIIVNKKEVRVKIEINDDGKYRIIEGDDLNDSD